MRHHPEEAGYFVAKWLDTVDAAHAFHEVGLFGLQHTVGQPRAAKWRHTVERLKTVFKSWGGEAQTAHTAKRP